MGPNLLRWNWISWGSFCTKHLVIRSSWEFLFDVIFLSNLHLDDTFPTHRKFGKYTARASSFKRMKIHLKWRRDKIHYNLTILAHKWTSPMLTWDILGAYSSREDATSVSLFQLLFDCCFIVVFSLCGSFYFGFIFSFVFSGAREYLC